MNTLRLLLIEDSASDATLFIDQIQNSLGHEVVEVEWRTRLSEALSLLESGQVFDQIWIDPGLPDLGQQNIGKALATLKRHLRSEGELRMISSLSSPTIAKQAAQHNVEVLQKDALTSTNNEILAIVRDMLAKRSSSGTIKVELARFEGTIAKMEYQIGENTKAIAAILTILDPMRNVVGELHSVKQIVEPLRNVTYELSLIKDTLKREAETAEKEKSAEKEVTVKRLDLMQAIILALITTVGSISVIVLPKVVDRWLEAPPATAPVTTPSPLDQGKPDAPSDPK